MEIIVNCTELPLDGIMAVKSKGKAATISEKELTSERYKARSCFPRGGECCLAPSIDDLD
jgi:hypothetical protein